MYVIKAFVFFLANRSSSWNLISYSYNTIVIFSCRVACDQIFRYHFSYFFINMVRGGRVVRCRCRTCDREVTGLNPAHGCCVPSQLSVPSLRDRLMSTSESWGVNGHTMRCTGPVPVVLRLWLVSG